MKIRAEFFGSFHIFALRVGLAAVLCAGFANLPAIAADCNTAALSALGVPKIGRAHV